MCGVEDIFVYMWLSVLVYVHVCVYVCVSVYACECVCACVCMCVCTQVCVCVCVAQRMTSGVIPHIIPLRQDISLNLEKLETNKLQ